MENENNREQYPVDNQAMNQEPQAYQNAQGYQDPQAYQNAQGYQNPQGYQDPQAYQNAQAYQNPQGYQDPQAYQNAQVYQNPQGYQDPQAYQNAQVYQNPQAYQDPQAYQNQGYQSTTESTTVLTPEDSPFMQYPANPATSPNQVMFTAAPAPKKKKGGALKIVAGLVAAVMVLGVVVGALFISGVVRNVYEGYIMEPKDQMNKVLTRSVKQSVGEYQAQLNALGTAEESNIGIDVEARAGDELLSMLSYMGAGDDVISMIELIENFKLSCAVASSEEEIILNCDLIEGEKALEFIGMLDLTSKSVYVALPTITDAIIGQSIEEEIPDLGEYQIEMTDEDVAKITEIGEELVTVMVENIGEVERVHENVESGDIKVKCDRISFTVDDKALAAILSDLPEVLDNDYIKDLLAKADVPAEDYEAMLEEIGASGEYIPEDFKMDISIWIHDGEVVGAEIKESLSGCSFYIMEPTGELDISVKSSGAEVKFGGQVVDGNGEFTLKYSDIEIGTIAVKDYKNEDGKYSGKITVTVSDEISDMMALSGNSVIGDIGEYSFVINFNGDEKSAKTELYLLKGDAELIYLGIDVDKDAEIDEIDVENSECYTFEEAEQWLSTVDMEKLYDLPDSILALVMGQAMDQTVDMQ